MSAVEGISFNFQGTETACDSYADYGCLGAVATESDSRRLFLTTYNGPGTSDCKVW